jgi:holo-[acyl-carrier protein] synthase
VILGIGSDLANIERIERTIERFGTRFLDRVFTEVERRTAERRAQRVATYAKRWAAKEACSKALGTGLRMGIAWRTWGWSTCATGQPTMVLTGWAAERLAAMVPAGHPGGARDADRRPPLGAGLRGDRGGAAGREAKAGRAGRRLSSTRDRGRS